MIGVFDSGLGGLSVWNEIINILPNEQIVYFAPGDVPIASFKYVKGATIYSYCNKHSLWSKEVE